MALDLAAAMKMYGVTPDMYESEQQAAEDMRARLRDPQERRRLVSERARRPPQAAPADPPAAPAPRPAAASGPRGPAGFMFAAQNAMAPGMKAHSDAISDVNDAISQEMRSRVAQSREMRRMQHEKDLKRMELDALLERVRLARG